MAKEKYIPWAFLDEFRGKEFEGKWPTVKEAFHISALRFPNNECFKVFTPEYMCLTYSEAEKKIKEIAAYLLSEGVEKGEKIAVSGKNSPEWALAYLGIVYAGCTVVPLDYLLKDNEMEKLISFGDVTRLFIDKERINNIDKDNTMLKEKISLEKGDEKHKYVLDLDGDLSIEAPRLESQDVQAILFTSGTTGTPKGVMLTNENLISDCYLAQGNMRLYDTDVFYAILPIHHAYTMLAVFFESFSCGACTVFGKKLVIKQLLKELKEGKVTMFLAVPMLFNKMIAALMAGVRKKGPVVYGLVRFLMGFSGFVKKVFHVNIGKKIFKNMILSQLSLENNRICICGGGPLPASTFKMFNELGIDFVQGYGLTETSPITHLNPTDAYIESSVGKIIPELEVKIVDPDSDGNGVIYIKGPVVMKGYYKNEEATKEVLSSDGWLNTGDVGHEDANHYLYLTGRAKSIIVTDGGKNVFPEEIEDHFQLYDEIDQICIIGYITNEQTKAEGIRAIIHPSADAKKKYATKEELSARMDEIIRQVNIELQSYKKITKVTISDDELPMTSTKKIKRNEVIRLFN